MGRAEARASLPRASIENLAEQLGYTGLVVASRADTGRHEGSHRRHAVPILPAEYIRPGIFEGLQDKGGVRLGDGAHRRERDADSALRRGVRRARRQSRISRRRRSARSSEWAARLVEDKNKLSTHSIKSRKFSSNRQRSLRRRASVRSASTTSERRFRKKYSVTTCGGEGPRRIQERRHPHRHGRL